MGEKLNLNKKSFAKSQYEKVIDTKFSQLANTSPVTPTIENPEVAINDFFQKYEQLFFQIPKLGKTNSHEYLINQSSEYIDFVPTNNTIQALTEEINLLQQQNLELNTKLVQLQVSGSI